MQNSVTINSNEPICVNIGCEQPETGLKKMVIAISQISTADPSLTLLENNTSLDFDKIYEVSRISEGTYRLRYDSQDSSLFEKIYSDISASHFGFNRIFVLDSIAKNECIEVYINSYRVDNNIVNIADGILRKNIITIYVNE